MDRYVRFEDLVFRPMFPSNGDDDDDDETKKWAIITVAPGVSVSVYPQTEKGQFYLLIGFQLYPGEPGLQSPMFLCRSPDEVTDMLEEIQALKPRHWRKMMRGRYQFKAGVIVG